MSNIRNTIRYNLHNYYLLETRIEKIEKRIERLKKTVPETSLTVSYSFSKSTNKSPDSSIEKSIFRKLEKIQELEEELIKKINIQEIIEKVIYEELTKVQFSIYQMRFEESYTFKEIAYKLKDKEKNISYHENKIIDKLERIWIQ